MQNIALGRLRRNLHLQPRSCVLLQPCCSIDVCYVFRWCTKPFLKQEREEKDKKQSSTRSSREATRTHKGGKGEMKKKRRKNVKPNRVNEKIMQASVARPLSSLSLFPALAFAISSTPIFFFFPRHVNRSLAVSLSFLASSIRARQAAVSGDCRRLCNKTSILSRCVPLFTGAQLRSVHSYCRPYEPARQAVPVPLSWKPSLHAPPSAPAPPRPGNPLFHRLGRAPEPNLNQGT